MAVIGFVGDNMNGIEAAQQRDGGPRVASVAAGENKADGTAERVDRDVPLGGQSPSGAPQSLVAAGVGDTSFRPDAGSTLRLRAWGAATIYC